MSYTIPSIDDFKEQFPRDFPLAVEAYGALAVGTLSGNALGSVAVTAGGQGYAVAPTVVLTPAPNDSGTGATAHATVVGGAVTSVIVDTGGTGYGQPPILSFSGGEGDDTNLNRVTDNDIAGAILDAQFNVNPGLFGSQQMFSRAFLYLAAHQLCEKLKMAAAGVQSQYAWMTKSKTVDDVSQSFEIPEMVKDSPWLANMGTTRYGAMYLQIITPLLVGNVHSAPRRTLP